jgi:predicted esterase
MRAPLVIALLAAASLVPSIAPGQPPPAPQPPIDYLVAAPVIDGSLDRDLAALPVRPMRWSSPSAPAGLRPPAYRLAYSARHLYVHVEFDAREMVTRDRAFQNGDGFVLVIARPRPRGAPSDEFYVVGVSSGAPPARWQSRFVWYRNVDLSMQPLEQADTASTHTGTTVGIEFLLPWDDVYPYHPWLGDIGFNLCVTRALAGDGRARYCAVEDGRVDSEQSPRRYEPVTFAPPPPTAAPAVAAALTVNHIPEGGTTSLRLATWSPGPLNEPLMVRVFSGEGTRLQSRATRVDAPAGLTVRDVEVPAGSLPRGGYGLTWSVGNVIASGRTGLSVLAAGSDGTMAARLTALGSRIAPGSASTLAFAIEELGRQRVRLRPYDVATTLRLAQDRLLTDLQLAEAGTDTLPARTGVIRRAFRSAVDGTLRPYSLRIPAAPTPGARLPLLVYLHGSGEDDRSQLDRTWLPQDILVLAPNGRGTSNWYTRDHAQDDIREAIDDVAANYPVDPERIVLAGFSMGGYGVYRTFLETPRRYRALAVFSGLPYAPGRPADAPDFLGTADRSVFNGVPLFVFHGGQDVNCPIADTRELVTALERAGAKIEFVVEPDKGHEAAGPQTLEAFRAWLMRVLGAK